MPEWNISMYGHKIFGTPERVMRVELRGEIFVCAYGGGQRHRADQTRNRNRRRKNRSGIPGMGQQWQAVLKRWMIMIPLPEITAAGAASGVCCSVEGCCRALGSRPDGLYIFRPTPGEGKSKTMTGQ